MASKVDFQRDEDTVRFEDVTCTHATPKAILVTIDGEQHWLPQSQVHDDSEVYKKGDHGTLIITRWIAQQRGLAE
jgi:hypothetical protein